MQDLHYVLTFINKLLKVDNMDILVRGCFFEELVSIEFCLERLTVIQKQLLTKLVEFSKNLLNSELFEYATLPITMFKLSKRWPSSDIELILLRISSLNSSIVTIKNNRTSASNSRKMWSQRLNYSCIPQLLKFFDDAIVLYKKLPCRRENYLLKFELSESVVPKSYFCIMFEIVLMEVINLLNSSHKWLFLFWILSSSIDSELKELFSMVLNGPNFNRFFFQLQADNCCQIYLNTILIGLEKNPTYIFEFMDLGESNEHNISLASLVSMLSRSCDEDFIDTVLYCLDEDVFNTSEMKSKQIKSETNFFQTYLTIYLNFFSNDSLTNSIFMQLTIFLLKYTNLYQQKSFRKITHLVHKSFLKYAETTSIQNAERCETSRKSHITPKCNSIELCTDNATVDEIELNCFLFKTILFAIYIITKLKYIKYEFM